MKAIAPYISGYALLTYRDLKHDIQATIKSNSYLLVDQVVCFKTYFFWYLRLWDIVVHDIIKNFLKQKRTSIRTPMGN